MHPFSTPWKHQKIVKFFDVSGGRERMHCEQIVYADLELFMDRFMLYYIFCEVGFLSVILTLFFWRGCFWHIPETLLLSILEVDVFYVKSLRVFCNKCCMIYDVSYLHSAESNICFAGYCFHLIRNLIIWLQYYVTNHKWLQ